MNTVLTKKLLPTTALFFALALPLVAQAQNIAIVNGKPVPKERFDAFMAAIKSDAAAQGQTLRPDTEKLVRDRLVMEEIMVQEAQKRGLERSPEYIARVNQVKNELLMQALFMDEQTKNPVTDADVKAEFDKMVAAQGGEPEYRARHILVKEEKVALSLLKQIKAGRKFEDLAKKNSIDPGSAQNGGDLGFMAGSGLVPEFAQALAKLKLGELTSAPVKTQYGYHLIKLEEKRDPTPPKFDDVKDRIKQGLMQQKRGAFVEKVRESAKTDYVFKN
ncbi:MAG: peptidylprolyl isomerase [Burkholderiales bacterium]